jgi:hypothetical protein
MVDYHSSYICTYAKNDHKKAKNVCWKFVKTAEISEHKITPYTWWTALSSFSVISEQKRQPVSVSVCKKNYLHASSWTSSSSDQKRQPVSASVYKKLSTCIILNIIIIIRTKVATRFYIIEKKYLHASSCRAVWAGRIQRAKISGPEKNGRMLHPLFLITLNPIEIQSHNQGCQMVSFKIKNPNLGKFWRALEWKMLISFMAFLNILQTFRKFYDHLVHFVFI